MASSISPSIVINSEFTNTESSDFLQGKWIIEADSKHKFSVIVTINGDNVIFSDSPTHFPSKLTQASSFWTINNWNFVAVSSDFGAMICHKPNSADCIEFWIRPIEWFESHWVLSVPQVNTDPNAQLLKLECGVCFDNFSQDKGILCGKKNHFICSQHASKYVSSFLDTANFSKMIEKNAKIKCFGRCCDCFYEDSQLKSGCSSTVFKLYENFVYRVWSQNHFVHLMKQSKLDKHNHELIRRLYRVIGKDGELSYDAFQCPNCSFGPVEHTNCFNLSAHGHSYKDGKIDNSCPNCKYYAPSLKFWNQWDGEFLKL